MFRTLKSNSPFSAPRDDTARASCGNGAKRKISSLKQNKNKMKDKTPSQQEVIDLVKEKGYSLDFDLDIPSEFKGNIEVLTAVLEHGNSMTRIPLGKISEDIFKNRDFLKLLVEKRHDFAEFPEWVRDDEEIARLAVQISTGALDGVSARLRSQRDFVLWAFSHNYVTLDIVADEALKNDLAILKLAVKSRAQNYGLIPEAWRTNQEVIEILLAGNLSSSLCFDCLPPEYRDNREIALKALNDDAGCFQHVSERLRDDKELALIAVGTRGMFFEYVSARLKDDKDVVLAALNEAGAAWGHISERLKQDLEVATAYVSAAPYLVEHLPDNLRDKQEIVDACLNAKGLDYRGLKDGSGYNFFSVRFKKDRNLTLQMSCRFGFKLSEAPEQFRADKEIVRNAVQYNEANFNAMSPQLRQDLIFVRDLVALNPKLLGCFYNYGRTPNEVPYLDEATREALFTTRIESAEHYGKKIVVEVILEDIAVAVTNQQRTAQRSFIEASLAPLVSLSKYPAVTYEENGPVGSYLTARFVNNLLLCGDFQFFVKRNSGMETLTNSLTLRYHGMTSQTKEGLAANDDFLKHEVYLVPDDAGSLSYENLRDCPRIYWGRSDNLPRGAQVFPSEESYCEAFSVLNQKKVYGTPKFIRIDDSTLQAAETDVDEVFGAARVYVDDHGWRFLIPHAEGALKSLEVLKATTDADDWAWIKSRPSAELDARREELLKSHFSGAAFENEVASYVGA
jgi:hypothetical protein